MSHIKIRDAIEYMIAAHDGQMYGNLPYWTHPIRVAQMVDNPTEDEYIAALFHDLVEDTDRTLDDIAAKFGQPVADIVELMTKDKTLTYKQNIQRIIDSGNIGAVKDKLADNKVNISGDKSHMSESRRARLEEQYSMSITMLEAALVQLENE